MKKVGILYSSLYRPKWKIGRKDLNFVAWLERWWYSIMFFIHPTSLTHLHIMYMRPAQIPPLLKNILFTDIQKVQTATTVSFTKGVETDLDYTTQREMLLILLQPFPYQR